MDTNVNQDRLRLQSLVEINQLLMGALEPDDLLQVILESTIRLFSSERCSVALIDEAKQQLAFVIMAGGKMDEFRIEFTQGIAGWVARTGQGVICNDVSQDPRFYAGIDKKTGFKTRSILCVPLMQGDRPIGVIQILNTMNSHGFTPEDLQLLTGFGGLAVTALSRAKVMSRLRNSNTVLQEVLQNHYRLVIGASATMQEAVQLARTVAAATTTVLLLGESGTGKELMARAIHQWSTRANHPFVAVNCVALTADLLESELFGHEKGAFTGAIAQKKGKFELAEGGTIFLDEIGEMAPNLQAKLLRVLQEKEFQRVGGTKDIRANVRVLAATNRDLLQSIQNGSFREDLYYRLNVMTITLPSLRNRKEDIPLLVHHSIERYCNEMKRPPMGIDRKVLELLQSYSWPGNVRELQNVIERAVVVSRGSQITESDLSGEIRRSIASPGSAVEAVQAGSRMQNMAEAMNEYKRALIRKALEASCGNQTQAAELLGLRQANLSRMIKTLGIH